MVAVTELVKNAYDADATRVTISFHGVSTPGGEIEIRDDGKGMDLDTLLHQWMEPAGSSKGAGLVKVTGRRRRVLGEKGVGRFATDKLASHLELISRFEGSQTELQATFDWDAFAAEHTYLGDIVTKYTIRPARKDLAQGTILKLTGLRELWTERMFRRLSTRLSRLLSPFQRVNNFAIRIESDEFPHYSGDLRSEFLERAPYRVDATFNGEAEVSISIGGARPKAHAWGGAALSCGPVRVRLFAFDLETSAFARIGPRLEVRAWLREWSGVSLYRDGFRIWPYGEPHDDWLRLDQRRVNTPVTRLSNNQIVGVVEISADGNPELKDQTNREGLINNRSLEDLRRLIYYILQTLEAERQTIRHPRRKARNQGKNDAREASSLGLELDALASTLDRNTGSKLRALARRSRNLIPKGRPNGQDHVSAYLELASSGKVAVSSLSSLQPSLVQLSQRLAKLQGLSDTLGGKENVDALRAGLRNVQQRIAEINRLIACNGLKRRAIDVLSELRVFGRSQEASLAQYGARIEIKAPLQSLVRVEMSPEIFYRVLHILAENAVDWRHPGHPLKITIRMRPMDRHCEVLFLDNGKGFRPHTEDKIFDALISFKEGRAGMGLTIVRDVVEQHGGSIRALVDGRRKGAGFQILLPRKSSRATVHSP